MERRKEVLSSTHIDSHNERMSKQALDSMAKIINSSNKPRLGLEHNMTLPPLGRINDAEVIQGEDGEYYLVAHQEHFTHQEEITIDGEKFIVESFEGEEFSFAKVQKNSLDKIKILIDPQNFESYAAADNFYKELKEETGIEFDAIGHSRKSELSDPEVGYRLAETSIYAYWGFKLAKLILKKTTKKLSDKISDDLSGLYDIVKSAATKIIKNSIPKNRPITHIVEFPADINISLIMVDKTPDEIIKALNKKTVKKLEPEIQNLIENFNADEIQFILNEKNKWELNYCLTNDGKSIGSERSHKKRDIVFKNMIEKTTQKQEKKKK